MQQPIGSSKEPLWLSTWRETAQRGQREREKNIYQAHRSDSVVTPEHCQMHLKYQNQNQTNKQTETRILSTLSTPRSSQHPSG